MSETTPLKVFCSHASPDKPVVKRFAERLRTERRIDAWVDEWEIAPGDNIVTRINEGLKASDAGLIGMCGKPRPSGRGRIAPSPQGWYLCVCPVGPTAGHAGSHACQIRECETCGGMRLRRARKTPSGGNVRRPSHLPMGSLGAGTRRSDSSRLNARMSAVGIPRL